MKKSFIIVTVVFTLGLATSFASDKTKSANDAIAPLMQELSKYQHAEKTVNDNLNTFDNLDFDVYSNQKWDRLHESHTKDILVHYPDGHTSKGIDAHIAELKKTFVFAPDTRIKVHPVRFGSGEWTGVIGIIEGTFSKPMPIDNGKTIPPTGKTFKLTMATLGHWTKDGVMDEEYLLWDNAEFMKQIGVSH
ncbi:MAG: ester cyclase [Yersinia sp. (in: enterobacteria)]